MRTEVSETTSYRFHEDICSLLRSVRCCTSLEDCSGASAAESYPASVPGELELDSLLVIPAYAAPHKNGRRETEAEYRFQMAKRAFAGIERVRVSDLELAREGTSYTYLTVEAVARMFPDAALYFLVGGDMLRDFKTWKNPERILAAATLVAAAREGAKTCVLERFGALGGTMTIGAP